MKTYKLLLYIESLGDLRLLAEKMACQSVRKRDSPIEP